MWYHVTSSLGCVTRQVTRVNSITKQKTVVVASSQQNKGKRRYEFQNAEGHRLTQSGLEAHGELRYRMVLLSVSLVLLPLSSSSVCPTSFVRSFICVAIEEIPREL